LRLSRLRSSRRLRSGRLRHGLAGLRPSRCLCPRRLGDGLAGLRRALRLRARRVRHRRWTRLSTALRSRSHRLWHWLARFRRALRLRGGRLRLHLGAAGYGHLAPLGALGSAAGPLAEALHVSRLREVEH
jgi:hypothetical protein